MTAIRTAPTPMHIVDGAQGEGGGQILRTSLALALVTGEPVRIENVRAGRQRPGLLRQHLTAVLAAAEVSGAEVDGARIGSRALTFRPGAVRPGAYTFSVGTAGSAVLVLHTVLPALLTAGSPSTVTVEGGTHNPFAPPFEHLATSLLPVLSRMGPRVSARLERHGFYPAGGGRIVAEVTPGPLAPMRLVERGDVREVRVAAVLANLPDKIARRELRAVAKALGGDGEAYRVVRAEGSAGPGNVLLAEIETDTVTTVVSACGMKGKRAEQVARELTDAVAAYRALDAPVGPHLADQLLLPLALAGGGLFRATAWTEHAATNAAVIEARLGVPIRAVPEPGGAFRVLVG